MKSYFKFTRKQRIGVVSLGALIVILIVILNVNQHRYLDDPADVDLSQIEFVNHNKVTETQDEFDESNEPSLFYFDPNKLGKDGWQKLGFSKKQTDVIVNYRAKNGPFKSPNDLAPIYVISDEKLKELKPYMTFSEIEEEDQIEVVFEKINVNLATQEELETIKGIGPTFAKRTISYREVLGGYVDANQFNSIYGITPEAVKALSDNVFIDLDQIQKIDINNVSKDELKKHPYLRDWDVVAAILSERDKCSIENLDFLAEQSLKTDEEIDLIIPYIIFE